MRKSNLKERIVNTAKQRFLKHGFYKVSMDSLVQELRTSKSSLYNHFSSKDELVRAVVSRLNAEINSRLEEILDDDKLSFKGKLVSISAFTKDLLSGVSEEFLKDLEINTPEIWAYYQESRRERINKYYRYLFETGVREGVLRDDIGIDLILTVYLSLTELPVRAGYIALLGNENQRIYEEVTEIFLKGILSE